MLQVHKPRYVWAPNVYINISNWIVFTKFKIKVCCGVSATLILQQCNVFKVALNILHRLFKLQLQCSFEFSDFASHTLDIINITIIFSSDYWDVQPLIGRGLHHILFAVIKAGALNFKMAASGFVSVTEEVMNMIKKIQFQIAQKMLVSLE